MRTVQESVSVVIPWDGKHSDWLDEAIRSIPSGVAYYVCRNSSKREMALLLNAALRSVVETPYTFIMGADDKLTPGYLEKLLFAIGETGDLAYGNMVFFGEGVDDDDPYVMPAPVASLHRLQTRNICGVFLARTRLLADHGYRSSCDMEDWDLVFRLAHAGARLVAVDDADYLYRQHSGSMTRMLAERYKRDPMPVTENIRRMSGGQIPGAYRIHATFMCQASQPQNYVRAVLPALDLPGVADKSWPKDNVNQYHASASVWLYPTSSSLELMGDARTIGPVYADVDDGYASPLLVPTMREAANRNKALRSALAEWVREQPAHLEFVDACDGVVCATPALAELYAPLNQNVVVIPNTVNPSDWPGPVEHDGLIVGWAAGNQHESDAILVEPAMRAASRIPGVRCVVMGVNPRWDFPYQHVTHTRSLQTYREAVSCFDIGLAPVRKGGVNHYKSDLKWLDYTMGGAATVCSDVECYSTIRGEALKARSGKAFADAVLLLISDERLRRDLVLWSRSRILGERHYRMAGLQYRQLLGVESGVAA